MQNTPKRDLIESDTGNIMNPGAIENEKQYNECLNRIDCLMLSDPEPDSGPGQELETLVNLVEDYESRRFKFSLPGVVDTVLFRMKEAGLRHKKSEPAIGLPPSRLS